MWHASALAYGGRRDDSLALARAELDGVGDAALGEWVEDGIKPGVVHVRRRMTDAERTRFEVPEPLDVRGTKEERKRKRTALRELLEYLATYERAGYGKRRRR